MSCSYFNFIITSKKSIKYNNKVSFFDGPWIFIVYVHLSLGIIFILRLVLYFSLFLLSVYTWLLDFPSFLTKKQKNELKIYFLFICFFIGKKKVTVSFDMVTSTTSLSFFYLQFPYSHWELFYILSNVDKMTIFPLVVTTFDIHNENFYLIFRKKKTQNTNIYDHFMSIVLTFILLKKKIRSKSSPK